VASTDDDARVVDLVTEELDSPRRLDRYLASHPQLSLSRNRIQKLIDDSLVQVDGVVVGKKYQLRGGERIRVTVPPSEPTEVVAQDIEVDIVYSDDHLVVVNKPAGMVTHPAAGNRQGTLVNALLHRLGSLASIGGRDRPGIVHRLDKNTSGLLVVARTDRVYSALQQMIQSRQLTRVYQALVWGHVSRKAGEINAPIGRSPGNRKKMAVLAIHGRDAITKYSVHKRFRSFDLLEITLVTGRTHQIRVHLAHLGHPVFGDPDYGGRTKQLTGVFAPERPLARKMLDLIGRQALHARELAFEHPITGESLRFESPLPEDFRNVLDLLHTEGA
jgi:23S rRNA pseudouridine1911/1915/1917 synthase